MSDSLILMTDPSSLKKLEKKLQKESKYEAAEVKHMMKDLASLEKQEKKAHKAVDKAQHSLVKAEKAQVATSDALNKATHKHEIAGTNLTTATKDLEIKEQQNARLKTEVEAKKAQVETLLNDQHTHNQKRESKLAQIHAARAGETPPQSATSEAGASAA